MDSTCIRLGYRGEGRSFGIILISWVNKTLLMEKLIFIKIIVFLGLIYFCKFLKNKGTFAAC